MREGRMAKIYVASSWRNEDQHYVVNKLREEGHKVYDFKNPPHGGGGFKWSQIDENWQNWKAKEYIEKLQHPLAQKGFDSDFQGMRWAEVCLLVLPCGRSAHLELGWMGGLGKLTIILTKDGEEPDLMYLLADHICTSIDEVLEKL